MSKLLLRAEDLIDSEAEAVKKALLAGDYIICCTMAEPGNLQSAVLENVTCLKETIPGMEFPTILCMRNIGCMTVL